MLIGQSAILIKLDFPGCLDFL